MTITTKGRYGLRLMVDIAIHAQNTPVPLRDIAQRQDISEKYLEQIVLRLSKANLVRGTRGARGGYVLTRDAREITAGDILRVVEGGLGPVECVEGSCGRADSCSTFELWRELHSAVEEVVDRHTLYELAQQYSRKLQQ